MIDVENVTIGMFPDDRYAEAAEALDTLRTNTPPGTHLLYVDAGTPDVYKPQIQAALDTFSNYTVIHADTFVFPAHARKVLIAACRTEVLALLQNDVLVRPDWLQPAIDMLNHYRIVDYISPSKLEQGQIAPELAHASDRPGFVSHLDQCALIGRTASFRELAPLPRKLNVGEQVLMATGIRMLGQKIVFLPESKITYSAAERQDADLEQFLFRWNPIATRLSENYLNLYVGGAKHN